MMPSERFERQLPAFLTDLAAPRTPDYVDDLLWQTAHTSQRPAWSLLERWLPMLHIARQPVAAPPAPWRAIGLGFVILALLLATLVALAVGTRPNLPAPFGPARTGLVVYASGGDILAADAATGLSTALVAGPEIDRNPRWSLGGTHFAFERTVENGDNQGLIFVARADGSDLTQLTPEPLGSIKHYSFSPDGKDVLIASGPFWSPVLHIAASDGSRIRTLDLGRPATNAAWRPPDGAEILFMEAGDHSTGFGSLFAVDVASGTVRSILEEDSIRHRAGPMWSPDGSQIAYVEWVSSSDLNTQIHVMAADGTGDRILPMPEDAVWQAPLSWSNDGTRLLAIRGYTGYAEGSVAVALPANGTGVGLEFDTTGAIALSCCTAWEWAPDDTSILGTPTDAAGQSLAQVLLDPVTGKSTAVPWSSTSQPSWQRLAP
jgi:Tol biopolymer transport system component